MEGFIEIVMRRILSKFNIERVSYMIKDTFFQEAIHLNFISIAQLLEIWGEGFGMFRKNYFHGDVLTKKYRVAVWDSLHIFDVGVGEEGVPIVYIELMMCQKQVKRFQVLMK